MMLVILNVNRDDIAFSVRSFDNNPAIRNSSYILIQQRQQNS